ncbi:pYEATS domain-containing protein [Corallococcus sicarius]|uniref:YEATS domain-containing protein n=1 Tax=Corallococcus sicarius TaxID=2316726 RepID=A0A3A8NU40_9BACT|nr:pYEATS domain-containing protein [Corallococcus sicarius]RKH43542.1 hypothetical protein D7X12_13010 [Corallococcus sicarius]
MKRLSATLGIMGVLFASGALLPPLSAGAALQPVPGQTQSLRVGNDAVRLGTNLWRWTAYIEAPDAVLRQVRCVEYTLHPTFPDPVREICERGKGPRAFPLEATGWGSFTLQVRVFFEDGHIQKLTRRLRL